MLRSCDVNCVSVCVFCMCVWWQGGKKVLGVDGQIRTGSVHLNCPRNMRMSVVVIRRVLFKSEVR